jgi:hypothetical protein
MMRSLARRGTDAFDTVGIAQLVERWIVDPVVAGSIPVTHPKICR